MLLTQLKSKGIILAFFRLLILTCTIVGVWSTSLRQKMGYKRWWLCDEAWCEQTLIRLLTFCENAKKFNVLSSFFYGRCKSMNFLFNLFRVIAEDNISIEAFLLCLRENGKAYLQIENHFIYSEFIFTLFLNVHPLAWKLFFSKKRHKRR